MERIALARLLGWRSGPVTGAAHVSGSPSSTDELRSLLAAAAAGDGCLFLFDRAWGPVERERAVTLMTESDQGTDPDRGWLCLPTGGTSGRIRFARHDQHTLSAAAAGFLRHFDLDSVNAVGVLPLHHVSGFMAWMRCELSGGRYLQADWKLISKGIFPGLPEGRWVISLVPTQLQRLLGVPGAAVWLRRFHCVLLGGGPAWSTLLKRAAEDGIPLAPCYGMTETAAMVAAQRPSEFAAGRRDVYSPMPHARISLDPEGRVGIEGGSVFLGYYPVLRERAILLTEDLGAWDGTGRLRILGRRDAVIISGGEKIVPAEVEEAILSTGLVPDAAVLGVPHPEWGAQVVAFVPEMPDMEIGIRILEALRARLAPYKVPKRFVTVNPWPRSEEGKVSRARLLDAWRGVAEQ